MIIAFIVVVLMRINAPSALMDILDLQVKQFVGIVIVNVAFVLDRQKLSALSAVPGIIFKNWMITVLKSVMKINIRMIMKKTQMKVHFVVSATTNAYNALDP